MNLTSAEIEALRVAIAEEMGWKKISPPPTASWGANAEGKEWYFNHQLPSYTTSLDDIQAACLERFKTLEQSYLFEGELCIRKAETSTPFEHQLTALDWSIAFARTAKIWRFK